MTELFPSEARAFWKALLDNASALLSDAAVLLEIGSFGRARALNVLAQEELGKALWIYDAFSESWSAGDSTPRSVGAMARHGRDHVRKYLEATRFGEELGPFWGDYSALDIRREGESWEHARQRRQSELDASAGAANTTKQRGFYVDRCADGTVRSPTTVSSSGVAEELRVSAQVVEVLLIQDHSRMKFEAVTEYDGTQTQQLRLLSISHPEDWAEATGEFRNPPR